MERRMHVGCFLSSQAAGIEAGSSVGQQGI